MWRKGFSYAYSIATHQLWRNYADDVTISVIQLGENPNRDNQKKKIAMRNNSPPTILDLSVLRSSLSIESGVRMIGKIHTTQ